MRVIAFKLSKPLYALGVHSAVFCLPAVVRRIVDPVLAQRILNVLRCLRLLEYLRDLLFRVFFTSIAHLICLPILQINLPLASLSYFSGTQQLHLENHKRHIRLQNAPYKAFVLSQAVGGPIKMDFRGFFAFLRRFLYRAKASILFQRSGPNDFLGSFFHAR